MNLVSKVRDCFHIMLLWSEGSNWIFEWAQRSLAPQFVGKPIQDYDGNQWEEMNLCIHNSKKLKGCQERTTTCLFKFGLAYFDRQTVRRGASKQPQCLSSCFVCVLQISCGCLNNHQGSLWLCFTPNTYRRRAARGWLQSLAKVRLMTWPLRWWMT